METKSNFLVAIALRFPLSLIPSVMSLICSNVQANYMASLRDRYVKSCDSIFVEPKRRFVGSGNE